MKTLVQRAQRVLIEKFVLCKAQSVGGEFYFLPYRHLSFENKIAKYQLNILNI